MPTSTAVEFVPLFHHDGTAVEQREAPYDGPKELVVPCSMRMGDFFLVRKPGIYIYIDGTMEQKGNLKRSPGGRGLWKGGLFHLCSITVEQ